MGQAKVSIVVKKIDSDQVNYDLENALREKLTLSIQQATVKREMAEVDANIRIALITEGFKSTEKWQDAEGTHTLRVAEGTNETIIKKSVISTLQELEWDTDSIKWFLEKVTKKTPYDYIDMRKVGQKDEGEEGTEGEG